MDLYGGIEIKNKFKCRFGDKAFPAMPSCD